LSWKTGEREREVKNRNIDGEIVKMTDHKRAGVNHRRNTKEVWYSGGSTIKIAFHV